MLNQNLKEYLEIAYFISGIVLAIVGLIGLLQLWFIRHEAKIRFKRLAIDNSIKTMERYYNNYISIYDNYYDNLLKDKIEEYPGTILNLPPVDIKSKSVQARIDRDPHLHMNELEIICASILSGSCDEEFLFKTIGKTLCSTIAHNYDILVWARSFDKIKYYNNTWELFELWRNRFIKLDLLDKKDNIENKISNIKVNKIKELF